MPGEASQGKQFRKTPSQKTLHKNRAGGVAQGESPEFKPQYSKKKKRTLLLLSHFMSCLKSSFTRCKNQDGCPDPP
jgi:hypothetical protein